jgi:hypothetical protein
MRLIPMLIGTGKVHYVFYTIPLRSFALKRKTNMVEKLHDFMKMAHF